MAKSYTPSPQVPAELAPRYQVLLEVLSGELTVSEASRRLGLSRNHFQTLLHRGIEGLIEGLKGKPAGRPRMPATEKELREEVARLQREVESLRQQVETTDRLLGLASGLLKGRLRPRAQKTSKGGKAEDE